MIVANGGTCSPSRVNHDSNCPYKTRIVQDGLGCNGRHWVSKSARLRLWVRKKQDRITDTCSKCCLEELESEEGLEKPPSSEPAAPYVFATREPVLNK